MAATDAKSLVVEFLRDGSPDRPLIRIYGTSSPLFAAFHQLASTLSIGDVRPHSLTDMRGVAPVAGCSVILETSAVDLGVTRRGRSLDFDWRLTPEKWAFVSGLIEPFMTMDGEEGHQWLAGEEARYGLNVGEIGVVLSYSEDGRW